MGDLLAKGLMGLAVLMLSVSLIALASADDYYYYGTVTCSVHVDWPDSLGPGAACGDGGAQLAGTPCDPGVPGCLFTDVVQGCACKYVMAG